jgi:hypothetical protein
VILPLFLISGSWFGRRSVRASGRAVKGKAAALLLGVTLFVLACAKGEGAFGLGSEPVPNAVLATAIRMHTIASGSPPIEGLRIVQVTSSAAARAQERVAKGSADDDTHAAAGFASRLDVSPADAANGVAERVGVVWRGIGRGHDGTARDVREQLIATKFHDGMWYVAGYLLTDTGAFAGTGDHAGHYVAEDATARAGFRCEMNLTPATPGTFRGTYRCAGRHRSYTYEPYKDVRYDGTIETFVEMNWTPARLRVARDGGGAGRVGTVMLARSAAGKDVLASVTVKDDGDLVIGWHPPSAREQGPSRRSSSRLVFQKDAATPGGGS